MGPPTFAFALISWSTLLCYVFFFFVCVCVCFNEVLFVVCVADMSLLKNGDLKWNLLLPLGKEVFD